MENLPVVDKDNDKNSSLSVMTIDKDWQVMNMFNISIEVKIHTDSHKDTDNLTKKATYDANLFNYYYMYEINISKSVFMEVFCYNYERMFMYIQTVNIEMLQSIAKAFIKRSTTYKSIIR